MKIRDNVEFQPLANHKGKHFILVNLILFMRFLFTFILFVSGSLVYGQSFKQVDSLLTKIGTAIENSKEIINYSPAKLIIEFDKEALPVLSRFFIDSTLTSVYSDCQSRYLTKGELAIILADRIESMPYYTITGVQNCLLSFCDENPNLIEYYFHWNAAHEIGEFKDNYVKWLDSSDRKKWIILIHSLKKKKRKKRTK